MKKTLSLMLLFTVLFTVASCSKDEDEIIETVVELSISSKVIRYPIGEVFPDREAVYMTVTDKTFNHTFHIETVNLLGFKYEEGFEYELKALRTFLKNPPADALNPYYTLIEIISKKKVE